MKPFRSGIQRLTTGVAAAALLALLAAGSADVPTRRDHTKLTPVPIPYGTLVNKNIRIESTGSVWKEPWSVSGGEDFRTPFSVHWWATGAYPTGMNDATVLNVYQEAYAKGARPVLIHVKGYEQPIYGLIVFNQAIEAAFGPARQSYYLEIPEEKLRQAMNGNVSVAFERINWREEWHDGYSYQQADKNWYSWILWMSRTPLVNEGGRQLSAR